ncbi:MAG: VanZ family protein [Porticoccaceae bacterium]|nr:VanZ family protein [Porticoccaceae bacterium]
MTSNKWRLILGLMIPAVILVASLLRSTGFFIHDIYRLQEYLGGDKATHAWMGMAVTLALWLLLAPRRRWWAAPLVAAMVLLLDEASQWWLPRRNFALDDLAMGLVGVGAAAGLIAVGDGAVRGYRAWYRQRAQGRCDE